MTRHHNKKRNKILFLSSPQSLTLLHTHLSPSCLVIPPAASSSPTHPFILNHSLLSLLLSPLFSFVSSFHDPPSCPQSPHRPRREKELHPDATSTNRRTPKTTRTRTRRTESTMKVSMIKIKIRIKIKIKDRNELTKKEMMNTPPSFQT